MPNFIGLDLSLTSTGIATDRSIMVVQTKEKGHERLQRILEEVAIAVEGYPEPYVVVEGYAFAKKSSHAFAQGELGGLVKHFLWTNDIPYVEVPPTSRAKFATGRGNAGKSEVVSHVTARSGIVFEGSGADDMADAWVLREMALAKFNMSKIDWPKKNLEALDKIEWK